MPVRTRILSTVNRNIMSYKSSEVTFSILLIINIFIEIVFRPPSDNNDKIQISS